MEKEENTIVEILVGLNRARASECIEKLPLWLRQRRYELLFDAQIEALEGCGLGEEACCRLRDRKKEVVNLAFAMKIPEGNYPFSPNLNESIGWLVRRTIYGNSSPAINFDLKELEDIITVSPFSYTFNINDGYSLRDLSCDMALQRIESRLPFTESRSPLNFKEMLTVRMITHHVGCEAFPWPCVSMAALGSRVGEDTPNLYDDGRELQINALLPRNSICCSFPTCEARF